MLSPGLNTSIVLERPGQISKSPISPKMMKQTTKTKTFPKKSVVAGFQRSTSVTYEPLPMQDD